MDKQKQQKVGSPNNRLLEWNDCETIGKEYTKIFVGKKLIYQTCK